MAKKGFFSWFRKDKSKQEAAAPEVEVSTQAEAEQARVEEENARLAAEQAEQERLAEEQARLEAENERLAAEQAEQERLAEKQARVEAENARLAAEQARVEAENARLAAEQARVEAEQQRIAEEQARVEAENARQAAEQARLEAESERLAAEQAEQERLAAEQAEQQRIAEEQARVEAENARQAAEQARLEAESELLAAEQAEQERLAAEQAEQQRLVEEQARVEAENARLAAEQAEQERLAEEQAEQERLVAEQAEQAAQEEQVEQQPEPQQKPTKEGFFARLKRGLKRTSENIGSGFIGLFKGKKIDDELFEELEEQLLIADVGVETTSRLIASLTEQASRKQLKDGEALYELMREEMQKTLEPVSIPLVPENSEGPFVILMVGVNGVGKTTTIGKLAKQYQQQGKSVMLAAGDTFRAAAVEQLQVWGQRNDIPVIAQHTGADSASVLFDALQAARARKIDILIADTAGRLQNKAHLMDELKKVVRVMKKQDESAPHEVMLTLDASTGQNAISQAQLFKEAVGVTGITMSKLDGTAKGGVIFAIADKFGIPIRHIGVGEQIDDLRTFDAKDFIDALFSHEDEAK
ncbi:signal recognition particle-docking protein FtsY [Shewanella rhizosphaerae]|uniref:signal recognition particle-docking protein FtsY n=1 Tax=Shewanella rhizosphaerae TaxID=2864207 RepID=UPI001C65AB69|nr:signal recognition particle-docking protein FtsY [Shewanella rhizosphaerae]QYK12727.1 signal recognition particle-docking protein FtsY [Shewanella rhizosphaerae]